MCRVAFCRSPSHVLSTLARYNATREALDRAQAGGGPTLIRVTDGLCEKYGQTRVIDTPIAESGILGTSVGMGIAGLRPLAEMPFSGFSYLMLGQLESHAARFRARTRGRFTVPLVVRMPCGGGWALGR